MPLSHLIFFKQPTCATPPQAWFTADKAVKDLRFGRMEREELKFKVREGVCGWVGGWVGWRKMR